MNTSKIIKAYIGAGTYSTTESIIQGDYGYILQIEGAELPAIYRVDFSNDRHKGEAIPVYGNENGAEVPEELIATGKDIFAFYYYIGENFGKTAYTWKIPNDTRAQNGDREPAPYQQDSIDQAISIVNEAVETAEEKAEEADTSARNAKEDADRAERAKTSAETAQGKAEEAQESAERAKDDAETSERNASESERKAKGYAETASAKADAITRLTAQATTLPDGSSATANYNPETGVMSFGIPKGKDGTNGIDGDDGYSPTASVSKSGKTATITIADKNGTTSAQVEDGTDGTDGISPTVTITPITGGHRITITDADGEHSADVMDGTGNVDDVQINGTSIVEDGVANVPIANGYNKYGLVKVGNYGGMSVDLDGEISTYRASLSEVKSGSASTRSLTPLLQHASTFYGLAKSAGDTTQSASSNAVGTYTEEAKIAIQKMLGIYQAPWELIREDTFTNAEEADHIINVDANGEAFELTDAVLELIVPTHDEDTVIADYLRVYFSEQNVVVATAFLGNNPSKTITANSAVNMAIASITQDNGLMCIEINQWVSRTIRNNKQILIEEGLGSTAPYRIKKAVIDSIKIGKVTGLMKYRIFGRRKWQ